MDYFFRDYHIYTNLVPTDIYPIQYGEEQCPKNHRLGCIRNNYIIHYVYNGKGTFEIFDKVYTIEKGSLFLIPPNESTIYTSDSNEPWLYRWVEFNGSMAKQLLQNAGLSPHNPVISDNETGDIGRTLKNIIDGGDMTFTQTMPLFWDFIYSLAKQGSDNENEHTSEEYIHKAEAFIKNNIHKGVSVNSAADYVGIDRSYLCRLFCEYKGISPKEYIHTLKMNMAVQYLKNPNISVTEAALSLGYSDCHVFSKVFKKHYGCSPSDWRLKTDFEQTIQV